MKYLIYIILICIILFFINKFLSKYKYPKIGAIGVFVGGVKSGKSAISVGTAISYYKKAKRKWKIQKALIKVVNKFKKNKYEYPEEPLLYSSIPLKGVPYTELTREHLLRQKRFNYKSIVLLDEASLIADSQLIKDKEINTQLLLFFKLFGHETHGGKCIINTHCISDLHYALKRTTSDYFYIHHLSVNPLFTVTYLREERYSEDGTTVNTYNEDVEQSLKKCIMLKNIYKKYDPFTFSILTDDLKTENKTIYLGKKESLKSEKIVSFRPEFYNLSRVKGENKNEKENS